MTKNKSKKTPKKKPLTKAQVAFLNALRLHYGLITKAAAEVRMHRTLHYKWLESSETYRVEYEFIDDDCLDVVENALMELIESGDTTATIFYLKTKGKRRGYVEKSEMDVNHAGSQEVIFRFVKAK